MTGLARPRGRRPRVLSLSSLEATRRNGDAAQPACRRAIEEAERAMAPRRRLRADARLAARAGLAELGLDGVRVHAFPMEGRLPNEWECPLDFGQVKREIGVGPLDRLHPVRRAAGARRRRRPAGRGAAGRCCGARGNLRAGLRRRRQHARPSGAPRRSARRRPTPCACWAIVEGPQVARLVRAAEALVLPSRYRVPFDDAVVDLARKAGRPVVTTHGGPAHLVRHEENGLITYDNPGSMVWALDRILGDPAHAERMGRNGRRGEGSTPSWSEVARHYLELCADCFPELTATRYVTAEAASAGRIAGARRPVMMTTALSRNGRGGRLYQRQRRRRPSDAKDHTPVPVPELRRGARARRGNGHAPENGHAAVNGKHRSATNG